MQERLDKHLVTEGFVSSRTKAKELIKSGNVKINDSVVTKSSYKVKANDEIEIIDTDYLKYVSRAGLKLDGAIDSFNIDFEGKSVMDIGSSTGGFTDCSLKHGARRVVAIDVGTDLMAQALRDDERVELHEQMNFKDAPSRLFDGIDIIVSDVSFISLKHIIDRISIEDEDFELVFLIKPQFECGKEIAHRFKGVITDMSVHEDVICDIRDYFRTNGYTMIDLDVSGMPGKSGNIEYVSHFKRNAEEIEIDISQIVKKGEEIETQH